MRSLRAVYNHARKSNIDLPAADPVSAIDWNKEHRHNTGMGPNDISGWLKELYALDNPLRREFHLLTLLSGSRPTALKTMRIEHIDLRGRLIHIPKPKGGSPAAKNIRVGCPEVRRSRRLPIGPNQGSDPRRCRWLRRVQAVACRLNLARQVFFIAKSVVRSHGQKLRFAR